MSVNIALNNKLYLDSDISGFRKLRVYHRKQHKKVDPRYLIKCGCCEEKVAIYYDEEGESLEINGVLATLEDWRQVFLPLLRIRHPEQIKDHCATTRKKRANNKPRS